MHVVLDTCVISEPQRPRPDAVALDWLRRMHPADLYLTSIAIGELAGGIERLPASRRRTHLTMWLDQLVDRQFRGRILDFDTPAARTYGRLTAASLARGRPPKRLDAQIAAVAAVHGMTVATRDVHDFEPFGVPLVNPWTT